MKTKQQADVAPAQCGQYRTMTKLLRRAVTILGGLIDHEPVEMCAIAELYVDIGDTLNHAARALRKEGSNEK